MLGRWSLLYIWLWALMWTLPGHPAADLYRGEPAALDPQYSPPTHIHTIQTVGFPADHGWLDVGVGQHIALVLGLNRHRVGPAFLWLHHHGELSRTALVSSSLAVMTKRRGQLSSFHDLRVCSPISTPSKPVPLCFPGKMWGPHRALQLMRGRHSSPPPKTTELG